MLKKLKNFCRLTRHSEGFTLVELVVVIAIVAILSGIAVPAYGAYVEKSQKAGDLQLLAAVNKAFAAAALENGTPAVELADGSVYFNIEDKSVDKYNEAFQRYFVGNEDKEFEVFKFLNFADGVFSEYEIEGTYLHLLDKLSDDDIKALVASGFITADGLGVNGLMNKVDFVTNLAASLVKGPYEENGVEHEGNGAYQLLQKYAAEMYENFGEEKLGEMTALKMSQLEKSGDSHYASLSEEEKMIYAQSQIAMNYAVLDAAKNMSTDEQATLLESFQNPTDYMAQLKAEQSGANISQAAMAYGLYTAYAYSLPQGTEAEIAARNEAIAKTNDPMTLLKGINDKGFQKYLTTQAAKDDLQGYVSSMNMINSASEDKTAVTNLLVNGYNDPELIALLQQAMNKK